MDALDGVVGEGVEDVCNGVEHQLHVCVVGTVVVDGEVDKCRGEHRDDAYVQLVFDTIANILYSLTYDTVEGVHNLMGIIQDAAAYATKYTVAFVHPTRPKASDDAIDTNEAVSLASRKAEAIHRA